MLGGTWAGVWSLTWQCLDETQDLEQHATQAKPPAAAWNDITEMFGVRFDTAIGVGW